MISLSFSRRMIQRSFATITKRTLPTFSVIRILRVLPSLQFSQSSSSSSSRSLRYSFPSLSSSSFRLLSTTATEPLAFAEIRQEIERNRVVVFMKGVPDAPQCGFSNAVCRVLDTVGVEYKGINVLANEELREGIKKFSDWPTIPQVYIDGEFIGGADILISIFKSGELSEKLEKAGLIHNDAEQQKK